MKRTSALRRNASYVLGLLAFASGAVAGAALADGLPPALGTSVALPTVSVSTPVATATVATPTVTAPTVTAPTVTAPTVTAPTVTAPTVTAPVATTVALPAVTTSAAKPVATVTTPAVPAVPAKTVSVAVPAVPTKTVSVSVATKPVSVTVAAKAAPVPSVHASVAPVTASAPLPARPAAVSTPSLATPTPVAAVQATTGLATALPQPGEGLMSPPAPLAPLSALPSGSLRQALRYVQPRREAGVRSLPTTGDAVLVSPLVSQIGTGSPPVTLAAAEIRPASAPAASTWSSLRAHPAAVTGGLLALAALAALGLAGAARSPTAVAACAELVRFPFPRFRVLPCPGLRSSADVVGSGVVHSPPGSSGHAQAPAASGAPAHSHRSAGGGPSPGRQVVPRLGGILGAGISTSRPWELVKTVVLAMLAAANVVLLALRWRLGRLQGR